MIPVPTVAGPHLCHDVHIDMDRHEIRLIGAVPQFVDSRSPKLREAVLGLRRTLWADWEGEFNLDAHDALRSTSFLRVQTPDRIQRSI